MYSLSRSPLCEGEAPSPPLTSSSHCTQAGGKCPASTVSQRQQELKPTVRGGTECQETQLHIREVKGRVQRVHKLWPETAFSRSSLTEGAAHRGPKAQPVSLPGATGCKGVSESTWSCGFPALTAAHQEGKGDIYPCCRAPGSTLPSPRTHQAARLPLCPLLPAHAISLISNN